ncbi:hypothetical protein HpCK38_17070 [Helicobacter pylori]
MRILFFCLLGLLFIACGGKKVDSSQSSSSIAIQQPQSEPQEKEEEVIPEVVEVIEEYTPTKKPFNPKDLKIIYFAFDSFALSKEMFDEVNFNVDLLKSYPEVKVLLEGNTDAYGSDEYNFALGTKRALVVKDALIVRGVHKDRIAIISFGETKPVFTTSLDAECRKKNRRVNFVVEK